MNRIRLLIADDHPVVRQGIRRILEMESDIEVVGETGNSKQVLNDVERLQPDVVLMDISMPGFDGIEVTHHLKKVRPEIKVIILTVHEEEQFLFRAVEAGADGYLLKDLSETELPIVIRRVNLGNQFIDPAMTRPLLRELKTLAVSKKNKQKITLTDREIEVLHLLSQGLSNKKMADVLYVSDSTLKRIIRRLCQKLQVDSRFRVVAEARNRGII
ncbi:MAG: response regulator transcription factor [Peptococcaceae bacterium]|nr:response regulator transcription factor [Peptococcaceae bacterium]